MKVEIEVKQYHIFEDEITITHTPNQLSGCLAMQPYSLTDNTYIDVNGLRRFNKDLHLKYIYDTYRAWEGIGCLGRCINRYSDKIPWDDLRTTSYEVKYSLDFESFLRGVSFHTNLNSELWVINSSPTLWDKILRGFHWK